PSSMSCCSGLALWTKSHIPSAFKHSIKPSIKPTETLKLFQRPTVRFARTNSKMSGWSRFKIPICAPRLEPALSTVLHEASNRSMYEQGPEAFDMVLLTHACIGRIGVKLYPTPPPR